MRSMIPISAICAHSPEMANSPGKLDHCSPTIITRKRGTTSKSSIDSRYSTTLSSHSLYSSIPSWLEHQRVLTKKSSYPRSFEHLAPAPKGTITIGTSSSTEDPFISSFFKETSPISLAWGSTATLFFVRLPLSTINSNAMNSSNHYNQWKCWDSLLSTYFIWNLLLVLVLIGYKRPMLFVIHVWQALVFDFLKPLESGH